MAPAPPSSAPATTAAPGGRAARGHGVDLCVALLTAALVVQSVFLLHVLSEAQPAAESARPAVRALGGSLGGVSKLQKWYCDKVAARLGGGEPAPAAAAGAAALRSRALAVGSPVPPSAGCAAEVSAALQAQPTCKACTIVMSCSHKPVPSGTKPPPCPACPPPPEQKCPPAAGGAAPGGNAALALAAHDHKKASQAEELDELGASLLARFTDMKAFLYPDETELAVYEHTLCYDGSHVVVTVPRPPPPSKLDPAGMGYVLGDPTGGCYDYRYYEPTAIEYTACKFDLFKFNRWSRYTSVPVPSGSASPRPPKGTPGTPSGSHTATPSRTPSRLPGAGADGEMDGLPLRRPNVDWALPLVHRRWGPFNRGAVKFREVSDELVHGPRPNGVTVLPDGALLIDDRTTAMTEWKHMRDGVKGHPSPGPFPAGFDPKKDPVMVKLTEAGLRIASVARHAGVRLPVNATTGETRAVDSAIYWLDGPLWAMAMDAQFDRHIYHASTRLLALYHAQRANATAWGDSEGDGWLPPLSEAPAGRGVDGLPPLGANHPLEATFNKLHRLALSPAEAAELDDETLARWKAAHGGPGSPAHGSRLFRPNRVSYASSPQWGIPSQDYVVLTGNNQVPPSGMIPFLRNVAALIAQRHTRFVVGPSLAGALNATTLLCARRGAVTGTHPRLFVNRADAWMFRKYAYDYAGAIAAGLHPHPHHPPRKVTVLTRKHTVGRNFENEAALIKAIKEAGVPYEVVTDMGSLSFKQQVKLMAGTGVLIAAHGAALVNAMFLPQHAVVIELFPYMLKKATYANLAGQLGLWYLPVFCPMPTLTGAAAEAHPGVQLVRVKAANGQDFLEGCVGANMSSVDSLLHHRCNSVAKQLPVRVDIPAFSHALAAALDIIAAFSSSRPEWAQTLAVMHGSPAPKGAAAAPAAAAAASKPAAAAAAGGGGGSPSATRTKTRTPTRSLSPTPSTAEAAAEAEPADGGGDPAGAGGDGGDGGGGGADAAAPAEADNWGVEEGAPAGDGGGQ